MRAELGSGCGREEMDVMSKLRIWSLGTSRCFEAVQFNRLKLSRRNDGLRWVNACTRSHRSIYQLGAS